MEVNTASGRLRARSLADWFTGGRPGTSGGLVRGYSRNTRLAPWLRRPSTASPTSWAYPSRPWASAAGPSHPPNRASTSSVRRAATRRGHSVRHGYERVRPKPRTGSASTRTTPVACRAAEMAGAASYMTESPTMSTRRGSCAEGTRPAARVRAGGGGGESGPPGGAVGAGAEEGVEATAGAAVTTAGAAVARARPPARTPTADGAATRTRHPRHAPDRMGSSTIRSEREAARRVTPTCTPRRSHPDRPVWLLVS